MPVLLGSDKAWRVRQVRDFVLSYQWLDGEPALFVYPAHRRSGPAAFVLPLRSAYLWAMANGHPDLTHAIPTAHQAVEAMGLYPARQTLHDFVTAVVDGLPDLIAMPPEPLENALRGGRANVGELTLSVDGETVIETEVTA